MSKNEYMAAKLRCKQALDLLSDALLEDAIEDISWIESRLCNAMGHGGVARQFAGTRKGRLAAALVREDEKRQARERLEQARNVLKGARS